MKHIAAIALMFAFSGQTFQVDPLHQTPQQQRDFEDQLSHESIGRCVRENFKSIEVFPPYPGLDSHGILTDEGRHFNFCLRAAIELSRRYAKEYPDQFKKPEMEWR
jgi:hypothetical protein